MRESWMSHPPTLSKSMPLYSSEYNPLLKRKIKGCVGGSVKRPTSVQVMISRSMSSSPVCEFEPHMRLCADSLEPGGCFGFCVSLSLCPSPAYAHSGSRSLSKISNIKKKMKGKLNMIGKNLLMERTESDASHRFSRPQPPSNGRYRTMCNSY